MFDFIATIPQDLHPILVHMPIALLLVSFGLTLAARFWPQLNETSWLLLVLGGLVAVPTVITGLIAHAPYEETSLISFIEPHQFLGLIGTVVTLAVLGWRWWSRRRGSDIAKTPLYLAIATVGLLWLVVLSGTGGQLVYEHGVNVRAVNPLLR